MPLGSSAADGRAARAEERKEGGLKKLPTHKQQAEIRHGLVVLDELAGVAGQRIVKSFDEDVLADEVIGPFGPGSEDFFLLHLIKSFMGVDGFLNYS